MSPRYNLSFCVCKTAWFAPEWQVYMGSSHHLRFYFMQKSDFMTRLTSLYGSQTWSVALSTHKSLLSARIKRLYGFQPSPVVLCMQNCDFWTRITSLYGSQTWPVILCMYNSVLSIRINSLYGSQPSSVVYACKTATFGQDLQISKGTRPHLSFCACKTGTFGPD